MGRHIDRVLSCSPILILVMRMCKADTTYDQRYAYYYCANWGTNEGMVFLEGVEARCIMMIFCGEFFYFRYVFSVGNVFIFLLKDIQLSL